jgi:hypothetical protein
MSRVRSLIMKARFSRSQEKALLEIHDPSPTPTGAAQAITDAGAITITEYATNITTTGAAAMTLADGATVGQRKLVTLIVGAGTATITPATLGNGTVVALAATGDSVEFVWNATDGWIAGSLVGTAEIDP